MVNTEKLKEILFNAVIYSTMIFVVIICLYPIVYVFSMSISTPLAAAKMEVWLLPKGFSLSSYKLVFANPDIWRAYYNTIWYAGVGTFLNVIFTISLAYPLSRKNFSVRIPITFFIVFTMFFSGGLIPTFILINKLEIYNTRWAMILPGLIGVYYVIIARTFFQSLPESLIESAMIEGANEFTILRKIIIPLSMPIIAVLILFYAVGHWNSYFSALIYLPDKNLQPLQLYLRRVLIEYSQDAAGSMVPGEEKSFASMQVKYSIIIVAVLPILCIYPFLQKYFVKGVMIGAIKE